jgi:hypothetical protein
LRAIYQKNATHFLHRKPKLNYAVRYLAPFPFAAINQITMFMFCVRAHNCERDTPPLFRITTWVLLASALFFYIFDAAHLDNDLFVGLPERATSSLKRQAPNKHSRGEVCK